MMSSNKSADGFSKILSKADCEKLNGNQKNDAVLECECLGSMQVMFFTFTTYLH